MDNYENNSKKNKNWPAIVITAVLFFIAGVYFGVGSQPAVSRVEGIVNKRTPTNIEADFSTFWKVWNIIDEKYIPPNLEQEAVISGQERVWGAIKGMVRSLDDPASIFLEPTELKFFEGEINGNFEGIGMEIGISDGILTVIAPLKNTPAYRAGVKSGDKIIQIDGEDTFDMGIDEAIELIRGEKGTQVTLVLFREDNSEPLELKITRDVIDIPTVDTEWIGDIFVIRLYSFSSVSHDLFREVLREFILTKDKNKFPKIILDLRGNPGGFLESSVDIGSWFLPAGKVIVREDFGDKAEENIYRSKGYNIFGKDLKMVVLIDGGSASASEILAGALREHEVATLIGSQSYGKGSVQELIKISSDSSLKITVARWITPLGKSISLEGLKPDIEILPDPEDLVNGKDLVMERAIEILTNDQ